MIKFSIIVILAIMTSLISLGQNSNSFNDFDFANHLIEIKEYQEALLYLNSMLDSQIRPENRDSVNYLLGKTYYHKKELDLSVKQFLLVSERNTELWQSSQFYSAFGYNHQKQHPKAIETLKKLYINNDLLNQLKYTQLAGSYLLDHDLTKYDSIGSKIDNSHLQLQRTIQRLELYSGQLRHFRKKSPVLAGIFSMIIPGSGKVYAGKTGEGISTFFQNVIFGLMAREAYKKDGFDSVRFAIFGSLFSTIYISNIWASTFSVKIYRNEYYESLHQSIMLDLHIPLRSIFK